jgi:quercetin dioxygenase-like cupin family protein
MARTLCEITSAHRYAPREVVSDPKAPYFGVEINDRSLTPGEGARIGRDSFRRLAEHPKVKPKKSTSRTRLMKTHSCFRLLTNALTGAILFTTTALQAEEADQVKVTDLMTKDLVNFPGKEVTMFTVDYPPGGADPVHRHNASAFVYVLEGSIVMQMKGEEKVTLHPGDTFYEDPAGIHLVGKNASDTKPAKFLVFLVKDKGAPLLIPVNE